jgi:hypothetical protein
MRCFRRLIKLMRPKEPNMIARKPPSETRGSMIIQSLQLVPHLIPPSFHWNSRAETFASFRLIRLRFRTLIEQSKHQRSFEKKKSGGYLGVTSLPGGLLKPERAWFGVENCLVDLQDQCVTVKIPLPTIHHPHSFIISGHSPAAT